MPQSIDIGDEVFGALQRQAEPFIDSRQRREPKVD